MRVSRKLWIVCVSMLAAGCGHGQRAVDAPAKAVPAPAPVAASPAPILRVVCLLEGDERRLEIFEREGGCFVRYTKQGNVREAASAKSGTAHCREVLGRIQSHLASSGFQCGS